MDFISVEFWFSLTAVCFHFADCRMSFYLDALNMDVMRERGQQTVIGKNEHLAVPLHCQVVMFIDSIQYMYKEIPKIVEKSILA